MDKRWCALMENNLKNLIYEVFVLEERCQAELRLSVAEVTILQKEYGAVCLPMNVNGSLCEKQWYLVRLEI